MVVFNNKSNLTSVMVYVYVVNHAVDVVTVWIYFNMAKTKEKEATTGC